MQAVESSLFLWILKCLKNYQSILINRILTFKPYEDIGMNSDIQPTVQEGNAKTELSERKYNEQNIKQGLPNKITSLMQQLLPLQQSRQSSRPQSQMKQPYIQTQHENKRNLMRNEIMKKKLRQISQISNNHTYQLTQQSFDCNNEGN
eukprot:403375488